MKDKDKADSFHHNTLLQIVAAGLILFAFLFLLPGNTNRIYAQNILPDATSSPVQTPGTPGLLPLNLVNPGYRPPLCPEPYRPPRRLLEEPVPLVQPGTRIFFDADEITSVDGVITAVGNVEVRYGNLRITAGRVEYNRETAEITASDTVAFYRGIDYIAGSTLTFNLVTQNAVLTGAYGVAHNVTISEEPVQDTIFFWGDEIRWEERTIIIRNGTFTGCDIPPPNFHYHISGDEIIIEPQQKVRIRNARLFYRNRQLLGIRSIAVPLQPRGTRIQPFFIPKIGRNALEGEYIKESIPYFWGQRDYGSIFIDWYRRIGFGYGIEHFYHLGDRGVGRVYYYNLGRTGAVANRYSFSNTLFYRFSPNLFVSGDYTSERYAYPQFTSPPIHNVEIYAKNTTERMENILLAKRYTYGTNRYTTLNLTNRIFIDDRWRADLILDFLDTDTTKRDYYRLNTLARLAYAGDIFDGNIEFDFTTGNKNFYVNRLPEVSMRSHPFRVGPFNSRVSLAAGNFMEMPSGNRALRSDIKFSILNTVFPISESGRFSFAGGARQFLYSTGDRKYLLKTRAALEQQLFDNFSVVVSHNFQDTKGYSPLAFDYYDNYHILGTTLSYNLRDRFRMQVTGGYDLNRKIWQTIIPQLEFCPSENSHVLLGTTYDRNNRLWMNATGEIGVRLTPWIAVKYWGLYDFVNRRMTYQNYIIEAESHDFITRLIYKSTQGELWLDFNLKLFPRREIRVGPTTQYPIIPRHLHDGAPREPSEDLL